MSTGPATAEVKPFTFDTDFDALEKAAKEAVVEDENEQEESEAEEEFEEEIVPTFSEEELERAKQEAYENGKKEGQEEAMASIQRETHDVFKAISLRLTDLFAAQEQANNVLLRDGIGIAVTIVRKLFPEMNRLNALGEVKRLIETTLLRLIEEPRIIVRIHPDMHGPLNDLVPNLKAGAGYEGRLLLKDDAKMSYGDCRLEWGDGASERAVEHMWQSIDQIIEENLGSDAALADGEKAIDVETGITAPAVDAEPETASPDTPEDSRVDASGDTQEDMSSTATELEAATAPADGNAEDAETEATPETDDAPPETARVTPDDDTTKSSDTDQTP